MEHILGLFKHVSHRRQLFPRPLLELAIRPNHLRRSRLQLCRLRLFALPGCRQLGDLIRRHVDHCPGNLLWVALLRVALLRAGLSRDRALGSMGLLRDHHHTGRRVATGRRNEVC